MNAKLAPSPGRIGLCYPDVPGLIMFRILGFLLLIVLLLALSFGWHPLATVKEVMGRRESYQVRQNGFNWVQQRKRRIEDAEREWREPPGAQYRTTVIYTTQQEHIRKRKKKRRTT